MKLWICATAVATGLALATPAAAQRSIHIGVAGGGVFPVGKLDSTYTSGPSGLVTMVFGSQDAGFGVRLDYQYDAFRGKAVSGTTLPGIHVNSVTANVVVPFRVGYVKPYLIGGVGLYPLRLPGTAKREMDWGDNAGAGIDFPIPGTTLGAFVEARYHDVNRSNTSPYHFVPITLGILF